MITRKIVNELSLLIAVMVVALSPLQQATAKLTQATLSFTPSGEIKPRVQSELTPVTPGTRYSTGATELREVLLPDGTVLSLGLGSQVVVEDYAYSRDDLKGRIVIYVEFGLVRVVGGLINNSSPILVRTPTAEIRMKNAAANISVSKGSGITRVSLLYGQSLSMTSEGGTETLVKPGFELVSKQRRAAPEGPSRQDERVALADMAALETLQLSNLEDAGQSGGPGDDVEDLASRVDALATEDQPAGEVDQSQTTIDTSDPLPSTDPPETLGTVAAGSASDGFGPGGGGDASRVTEDSPSQSDDDQRLTTQTYGNLLDLPSDFDINNLPNDFEETFEPRRDRGRTANRLYNSRSAFTQILQDVDDPSSIAGGVSPADGVAELNYVFSTNAGLTLNLTTDKSQFFSSRIFSESFGVTAPFLLANIEIPTAGKISRGLMASIYLGDVQQGSLFSDVTQYKLLQAGFNADGTVRGDDNFLVVEVSPGIVDSRFRDDLKQKIGISNGTVSDPIEFIDNIGINLYNALLRSDDQVDLVADVVISGISDAGIMASDVKGPQDGLQAVLDYHEKTQPILDNLDALEADNYSPSSLIDDAKSAIYGRYYIGRSIDDSENEAPTIDIDAIYSLALQDGSVNDSVGFLNALGSVDDIDFTTEQLNALAQVIVGAEAGATEALAEADLSGFAFLDDEEKATILDTVNSITSLSADPDPTERFLFAAGDVDARLAPEFVKQFSVDRFFISAGLENFNQKDEAGRTLADGIRAFLRQQTGLDLVLADTGLLVINSGSDSSDAQNAALHADFGLEGIGSDQQSTISVTIGDVDYQVVTCAECGIQDSVEAVVSGETIGSSHGTITPVDADGNPGAAVDDATVAFASPLRSTAAGGGNPTLNRDGYAGYFVLENYDPSPQDAGEAPLAGGTERPIGNPADSQDYAYLRLATATGTETFDNEQMAQRKADDGQLLAGWLAGLGEYEVHDEQNSSSQRFITPVDSGDTPQNFVLQVDSETNRVQVSNSENTGVSLYGYENGQRSPMLGGLAGDNKGTSAYIDSDRFAARTQSGGALDAALVSGELVRDGLPAEMQAAIPDYQYLKWGFFFGDTLNDSAAGKQMREHVHLATWVAGKVPQPGDLPTGGEVSYTGHAIGNVYSGGAGYTAVGSYQNTWNFADRRGTANLDFDRANYTGNTSVIDGTASFQGRLDGTALGPIDASNRIGGLRGNFVQGGDDPVAGLAGRFSIQEKTGDLYRASGTFGAERNPPQ